MHLSFLEKLRKNFKKIILYLGSETSFPDKEELEKIKEILNIDISYQIEKRTNGNI